jgi:hypothetical protein
MRLILLFTLTVCALAESRVAGDVTLEPGSFNVVGVRPLDKREDVTVLPASGIVSLTVGGGNATTNFDFTKVNGQAIFEWDFTHVKDVLPGSSSGSHGEVHFTVDADMPYEVFGIYVSRGLPWMAQRVILTNETTNTVLLDSFNFSRLTMDEILRIGHPDGDSTAIVTGDTMGMLTAAHSYKFDYSWSLAENQTGAAQATGNMRLAVIPEPRTMSILGTGLAFGIAASMLHRRRRQPI